jgi:hypothetical protein
MLNREDAKVRDREDAIGILTAGGAARGLHGVLASVRI